MANNSKEKTIGQKIKAKRNQLELTQDELARKAEIPYATLVKIETGGVKSPSVDTVKKSQWHSKLPLMN